MKNETLCVHEGTRRDKATGGVNSPIYTSSACEYIGRDRQSYPRYFNQPNQEAVVAKICALEGAEGGVLFASGMAAISTTLLALCPPGAEIVMQSEVYGGTDAFLTEHLIPQGFSCQRAGTSAEAIIEACSAETKVIYIETPTNPLLSVVDIRAVATFARSNGILTIIDNTFATPILQTPLALGIDVVVHSGTKYFGGHADMSSGIAVASTELADKIRARAKLLGGNLNAQDCYLLERSLKTLALRVERQSANAGQLALWLESAPGVARVHYPGLVSSPYHEIAKAQMRDFGAMLSFELASTTAATFMGRLKLICPALSLGGVETTICAPAETSHLYLSDEAREEIGISEGLLRLSVGIENVDDLISDIAGAL
ncbi:trans-sulfuration enzyme family protein [Paremcibacter congregatus]|uniref:trans-sulfuration enzyme family protein n=1 Tax=Paremcibacter congregatus TaxID=2043170 RepID=UPI003A90B268